MNNIVVYKSEETVGYRPQMFKEWVVGEKINCNGVSCEIIDVLPNNFIGIGMAKQIMANIRKEWKKADRPVLRSSARELPEDIKRFMKDLNINF